MTEANRQGIVDPLTAMLFSAAAAGESLPREAHHATGVATRRNGVFAIAEDNGRGDIALLECARVVKEPSPSTNSFTRGTIKQGHPVPTTFTSKIVSN